MIKLAAIPPLKMPVRPTNFINAVDPKPHSESNIPKVIVLTSFFVSYGIFFALFLYFNVQWKSMEFKLKDDKDESCTATVSMIDFIGDISSAYFCITLLVVVGLISIFFFKKSVISSNLYVILTIPATVTSFLSFATIAMYAFGNGWSAPKCANSEMVQFLNNRLVYQLFASLLTNIIFIVICYHLHKKQLKLMANNSRNHPGKVYSISPPEFVTSFPPPPPYYSNRQTC